MSLLRLEAVTRQVELPDAPPLQILRGIDLTLEVGDHVSIVGRSGSGKSTLLNLLGLLDTPTSGEIFYDDLPASSLSAGRRDRARGGDIGFIFQQFNLLSGRTALENVMTPLLYATGRQFWRRRQLAAEMLDRVGLSDRLTSMPEKLSGGEQQRVAIARALVQEPKIILADEPMASLDPKLSEVVIQMLEQINRERNITVIVNIHVLSLAKKYSKRMIAFRKGEVVFDGPPHELTDEKIEAIYHVDKKTMDTL